MALEAGTLQVTVEFAKDLADKDWFGKQDPYCLLSIGNQKVRSRTHIDGGRNPVWNDTFRFTVVNENTVTITLMDEDTLSNDDWIGTATISCARAREQGRDHIQAPVMTKHNKQRGFISVALTFTSNNSLKPANAQSQPQPYPYPYPQPQPMYYAPPGGYAAPPPAQPYPVYPPQSYPSATYPAAPVPASSGYYPPPAAPAPYPQQPYPQQPYPSGHYPSIPVQQPPPAYGQAPAYGQPPYPPTGYRTN